jgi:hypothetical protein
MGIHLVGGQLPGKLGEIAPEEYKQYELQLIDGDVSVDEYLKLLEERDRPPWVSFVFVLKLMREKAAPVSRWGYFYSMIENLTSYRASLIERPGNSADLYSQLKKNIQRLVNAYKSNLKVSVEESDGSVASIKMNNINDFTIQIVALLKNYCFAFTTKSKQRINFYLHKNNNT